ncbi:hypothetical protein [Xanthomonas theicola]|uniref:hypothetical protein n=1 Tax=Xanthomonas theicola TaxID=56464 RepID=UPI001FEB9024|nr:hypothetical protein [Xanthomonas theicola]
MYLSPLRGGNAACRDISSWRRKRSQTRASAKNGALCLRLSMSAHWLGDGPGRLDARRQLGMQRDTVLALRRALPSLLVYALLVIGGAQLLARYVSHDERALRPVARDGRWRCCSSPAAAATTPARRTASPARRGRGANCRATGNSPPRTATCPARTCWRCTTAPNRNRGCKRCCCPTRPAPPRRSRSPPRRHSGANWRWRRPLGERRDRGAVRCGHALAVRSGERKGPPPWPGRSAGRNARRAGSRQKAHTLLIRGRAAARADRA